MRPRCAASSRSLVTSRETTGDLGGAIRYLTINGSPVPLGGTVDVAGYRVIDGGALGHRDFGGCDAGSSILVGVVPAP